MGITQALRRAVQQRPDQVAVRFGDTRRSFKELVERVARLAGALQALGLNAGDRVAILSLNSDRYLEYQMAVLWAGGVLNPCNTRWSTAEIQLSLEDSDTRIMLADDTFVAAAEVLRTRCACLDEIIYCGHRAAPGAMHDYEGLIARHEAVADALRGGDDLAGIFYTGGTTGFPKGVMLSHNNLLASALGVASEGIAPEGAIYLHAAPMFHLADLGIAMAHWLAGSCHVVIPAFTPEAVLQSIATDRVSHMLLVPTMIQMLIDAPAMKQACDLSSLQFVGYGASPISEALLVRAMAALPGVDFFQAYGMTELAPVATVLQARYHVLVRGRPGNKIRSAGRSINTVEVRVVDEHGNEVRRGTVGEVIVRGPNVMLGYWKNPAQTAAVLRDGWLHTGDCAYMDEDGFIFVVDRLKDMIITGGENVYSSEVEQVLASHPAVAVCAVIGIPSPEWGETVHAVVVLKVGQQVAAEVLIHHCKRHIAGYKCPRSVYFTDALPVSGAGKILKSVLREPHWNSGGRQVA